jgi:hypothetical protein
VLGSIPTCVAHLQTGIIGQAMALAVIGQTGHFWIGQQVVGSVPATTGCCPPGQARSDIGQGGGFAGSHASDAGTHWPVQVRPVQVPDGSQLQVVSFGGQVHPVAGLPPAAPPAVAPPAVPQPQPTQVASHRSPAGQSASVAHWGCCGWQVQGPPHGSVPTQTAMSPGLHVGLVHPQSAGGAAGAGPLAAAQPHW